MSRQDLVQTTPFPNALFERMPKLRDTEWRVLCVIVRFTVGFVDPTTKRRKMWAAISHNQFKRWTGRESAAISQAIDHLVRAHLILVADHTGRFLTTTYERRRIHQSLRFCLAAKRS